MVTIVWGITLITQQDKTTMPITFVLAVLAVIASVAFDSIISSSTNSLMFFLSAFLAIVWLVSWLKVSRPSLAPILSFFLIVFMAGAGMTPRPIQSFDATLTNLYSILTGMVLATVLWVIDQVLRFVEVTVERSAQGKIVY
jgi:hypothetical protein